VAASISTPVIALVAVALLVPAGCGDRDYVTVPHGKDIEGRLARARRASFPIYYAGRSFAGQALSDLELDLPGRALVSYGTCRIALPAEGGCTVPVQIQHFPFKPGDWRLAVDCHRRPSLLGVPTVRHDGLVLFTGRELVKIYARNASEDRRVALALRRVSDNKRVRRLPQPDASVAELQREVCR